MCVCVWERAIEWEGGGGGYEGRTERHIRSSPEYGLFIGNSTNPFRTLLMCDMLVCTYLMPLSSIYEYAILSGFCVDRTVSLLIYIHMSLCVLSNINCIPIWYVPKCITIAYITVHSSYILVSVMQYLFAVACWMNFSLRLTEMAY